MPFSTISFHERSGDRLMTSVVPERLNALNLGMLEDFHRLFDALREGSSVRVLIVTGAAGGSVRGDLRDESLEKGDPHCSQTPRHT